MPEQPSLRQQNGYKMFIVEPLHITHDPVHLAVENLNISQNFSPSYNQQDAYGRMDPIVTFQNTKRTMNITFSCQSHHFIDGPIGVVNNIRKINRITQFLYPSYQDVPSNMRQNLAILKSPPFFRITYGNYIGSFSQHGLILGDNSGLTGYISSFNHQLGSVARNVAMGYREKDVDGKLRGYRALPREIKVNMQFHVIHDKPVGWKSEPGGAQFSVDGYGENFPYNAGNSIEEAFLEELRSEDGALGKANKDTNAMIKALDDDTFETGFGDKENAQRAGSAAHEQLISNQASLTDATNKMTSPANKAQMAKKLSSLNSKIDEELQSEYDVDLKKYYEGSM